MTDMRTQFRALRGLERRIVADPAWVRATRKALVAEVVRTLPRTKMGFWARQRELIRTLWTSRISQFVRKPVLATLSVGVVAMGGSIFSVSAAERSLPGDFFYGLKLVTEQARLALTPATEDKLKLKTEFTERRINEFQQIASTDPQQEKVVQAASVIKSDLNTIKQQLTQVTNEASPQKAAAAAKLVDQKTTEVINALQQTKAQLTPEAKAQVTDVQSVAADTGVKAIEVLVQSGDGVSTTDIAQAIQGHAKAVTDATPASLTTAIPPSTSTSTTMLDVASSTVDLTSSTLPVLVNQVKDLTTQAFAVQKAQDQIDAASAMDGGTDPNEGTTSSSASATGTPSGTTNTSTTSTSSTSQALPEATSSSPPTS